MNRMTISTMSMALMANVSLIAVTPPAVAQQSTEAASDFLLEEIVVTARRREESLRDVPVAVSVQSGDQLDLKGAADITALQRLTPNLTLQVARGTNSTLTSFIRGIGQQDPLWGFEPGVGLYVDDVYIARPQGAILDIFDIERIEVLRGPQGTLYGRNTIGGAVKYVTARLGAEPQAKVRANVGSYGQHDLIVSGSAPVGDRLAVGGAFALFNRNGYGTNHFTGNDTNNKDAWAGRLTMEFMPSDQLFFRISADRTEDNSNANHGHRELAVPAAFSVPPFTLAPFSLDIPADAFPVQEDVYDTWAGLGDTNEVITQGISLLAEWTLNEHYTIKSISAYRDGVTHGDGIDFDGTPAPLLDIVAPESVYEDHQYSEELQLLIDHDSWSGVVGAYYMDAVAQGAFDTVLALAAAAIPNVPTPNLTQGTSGRVETKSYAVFADIDIDLSTRWHLSLGGRWTRDEKTGTVFKANYLGLGSPISGGTGILIQPLTDYTNQLAFEEFTPRVSLAYDMSDTTNIYASYSRGFKSGGFDMRGDAFATPATMEGYDPETVETFELGFKGSLFNNRLSLATALFHASYDGQQVTSQQINATNTGVVSFVDNVGKSTIKGAELETTAFLTDTFSINVTLGYTDAAFDEYLAYVSDGTGFVLTNVADDRVFQNTPKWNGNVGFSYMVPLDSRGSVNIHGAMSFRSATSMFETPVDEINQDAYQLLDLSVVWTSAGDHWRVGLHGRNLTNTTYRTGAYNFPGLAFGDSVIGFYGPPRTVTASIEYRF
ncbi:TonB-dependent receptor [Kordiimonas lacus]|uniref:Iron complex outermembrane recepter protein n=1 Tax=Kordiimonas lacus TaxID=637679 RepID=A0A1G6YLH1_9PROT|nr:TonB-dependent receptor [Kordiimonas lacus]SDD91354.1 iron complex outermembrane recepter protein [Kordiimonas lacus]